MNNAEATKETAAVREPGAKVGTPKEPREKNAPRAKGAARASAAKTGSTKKTARTVAKPFHTKPSHTKPGARGETKGGKILELIRRPKGATLAELMKATAWQAHSVRGFISNARRRNGLRIEFSKNDAGQSVYRMAR